MEELCKAANGGEMSIFRILHLSHLHRLDISQLLALLKQENYLKNHALLISGFYELDPHTELSRSINHLNRLSSRLNLESEKVLCIPEPGDLRFSLSTFNNALFLPFFRIGLPCQLAPYFRNLSIR